MYTAAVPPPITPFAAAPVQEPTALPKLGFYAFCLLLFALFSRLFDLYFYFLHLPGLSEALALLAAFVGGGIMRISKSRTGMALIGLTAWLFLTVPFAYWRGGSIPIVIAWLKGMMSFVMAAALIVTVRQCRTALITLGFAGAVGGALLYLKGQMVQGRLSLQTGRFKNANDAAMLLLLCLPCLCLIIIDRKVNKLVKAVAVGSLGIVMIALVKTGSRAGFIGFLVLCFIVFLQASGSGKLKMVVTSAVLAVAFFTVVPRNIRDRYTTFFANKSAESVGTDEAEFLEAATGSSEDRWAKLMDSIALTIKRPIFGVGPGNFSAYYADVAVANGEISNWNGTHNTYTQYSSETGIPGLILYLMVLSYSIKDLGKVARRAKRLPGDQARTLANIALTLRSTFVAFCVCTFFEHVGYEMIVPVMAGLAAAVITAGELELPHLENAYQTNLAASPQTITLPQQSIRHRPYRTVGTYSSDPSPNKVIRDLTRLDA